VIHVGFDYEFNSLQSKKDEFSNAFTSVVSSGGGSTTLIRWTIKAILVMLAPSLLNIVRLTFFFNGLSSQCGNSAIAYDEFQEIQICQEDSRPYRRSTRQ
jgi:hypothetical protein